MKFEKTLLLRRSVRCFTQEQIREEELQQILAAAQMAPLAAGDDKTTHITVVQNSEILNKIRIACELKSRNTGSTLDAFYGAPTVIFLSATDISEDHIEYCNVACVIENILLQAAALNLGSVYIWGCLRKLRRCHDLITSLELPEGYEILSAAAIGYPVSPLEERELKNRIAVSRL